MTKTYNVTRDKAAKMLGVSTRTVDRYVKSGKLSYKKVANKVLMAREELAQLAQDFSALHQEVSTEIVSESNSPKNVVVKSSSDDSIDQKLDKFYLMFKEKDNMLEEKNKALFLLQRRIGELETRLQSMVSLPDYTQEKQETILEKKKLEQEIGKLHRSVKNEKTKGILFIGLFLTIVVIVLFFYWNMR